jgi:Mg-chelatase subunit ChlD
MSDKIVPFKKAPLPFKIGKPVGIAARKQAAALVKGTPTEQDTVNLPPAEAKNRIGIVFDDSGSMYGNKITDAHAGVEEFIRNCDPKDTALAVYPMNAASGATQYRLSRRLYEIAQGVKTYSPTGGTPLFETMELLLRSEALTRGIVFSDGEPNYNDRDKFKESSISEAIERKIPIDTVFIGSKDSTTAIATMQEIAERTGGVFLIFEPGKANFRTAFKYLSPGFRAMLADKSFVEKVESGEVK